MNPTIVTLLKVPTSHDHGEAPFWKEWGATYLERFVNGVRRYHPFWTIKVMTDWPILPDEVEYEITRIPLEGDALGWWAKLNIFRLGVCQGVTLYSDLDNVVCGPLDDLLAIPRAPIVMLDDRIHPGMANGACFVFDPERMPDLWTEYCDNPLAIESEFSTWPHAADQAFIADRVRKHRGTVTLAQEHLPAGRILNARAELEHGAPYDNACLVFGSFTPKPHQSKHPFYAQHWR